MAFIVATENSWLWNKAHVWDIRANKNDYGSPLVEDSFEQT